MSKQHLTQALVTKLAPPADGRLNVRDARTPGLVLTVTPKGTKSYYLYRRVNGRPSRILLGHHPLLTVEAARDLAVETYAETIRGKDPNAEKRAQRRGGITVGDVFDHYVAHYLEVRAARRTIESHKGRFDTCLAEWRSRRLDSIGRGEVVTLHARLGRDRGKTTANRAVQLLRRLFNYATGDAIGAKLPNPAARVDLYPETPRERFLRADELPKFFEAVDAEPDESMRDFFLLALYTGARRWNVLSMRWPDVDLAARTWTIPAEQFKTRKSTVVVLSSEALAILKRRQKHASTDYVFPSHGYRGHLVEPKGAWQRLRDRSGLADLRIHDLRRTLGSWQAAAGSSLAVIGKSLGHTSPSATAIYARLELDAVRQSVEVTTAAIAVAARAKAKQKGGAK